MAKFSTNGKLFKFAPYNQYLFNLLVNGEFWMGAPDKLNDPFEGDFLIKDIAKYQNEKFIKKLLTFKRKNFIDDFFYDEQFDKSINDEYYFSNILYEYINGLIKNNFGISCFTRNPKSLKMWSHYADSHKGVCIIFNETQLKQTFLNRVRTSLEEVNYSKSLPELKIIDHEADENGDDFIGIDESDTSFMFNKLAHWKEEKEVRLLLNSDFTAFKTREVKFKHSCIEGIIFGARVESQNIMTLIHLVEKSTCLNHIKFYLAKKDLENSRIEIIKPDI